MFYLPFELQVPFSHEVIAVLVVGERGFEMQRPVLDERVLGVLGVDAELVVLRNKFKFNTAGEKSR